VGDKEQIEMLEVGIAILQRDREIAEQREAKLANLLKRSRNLLNRFTPRTPSEVAEFSILMEDIHFALKN
jgi:hypothetical protein